MNPVKSVGIFGAVSSTTVSALSAVERASVAIHQTTNMAVSLAEWGNEEIDNLRKNRSIKREVESEIYRTMYVLEAAAEVAKAQQAATESMKDADESVREVYDALVAKHLGK